MEEKTRPGQSLAMAVLFVFAGLFSADIAGHAVPADGCHAGFVSIFSAFANPFL